MFYRPAPGRDDGAGRQDRGGNRLRYRWVTKSYGIRGSGIPGRMVCMEALADRIDRHGQALERGHHSPLYVALMHSAADNVRVSGVVNDHPPRRPWCHVEQRR